MIVRYITTVTRCFASLYTIVSRRWPLASFGLPPVVERKVKDGPRARKPPIKSKGGESSPWRISSARTAAVRLPPSECDRENTLWPGLALGRRVLDVSCVLEIEVRVRGRRSGVLEREIVSVPSYVGGGRFASIGPNKLNTAGQLSNRVVSLPQHECGRTRRFKEIEAWSRLYDKKLCTYINYCYTMK